MRFSRRELLFLTAWPLLPVLLSAAGIVLSPRPDPVESVASCARPATSAAELNGATVGGIGFSDSFRTDVLPDGRWMSVTGDTARTGESLPAYDNSVVIWDRKGQRRVGAADHFFPRWSDGSEFWPYQWVAGPTSPFATTVYVTGSRQFVPVDAVWTSYGAYIAVITVPRCGTPAFVRYLDTPSSGYDDTVVQWNAGITRADGWFWIHGALDRPDRWHARDGAYVARTQDLAGPWQYWTGSGWSTQPGDAVATLPMSPSTPCTGTESSYTLEREPTRWSIITKCDGGFAEMLGRYSSTSPTGPWSWTPLLPVCAAYCYLTGAAPVPSRSGNLIVQWSRFNAMPEWAEVPR